MTGLVWSTDLNGGFIKSDFDSYARFRFYWRDAICKSSDVGHGTPVRYELEGERKAINVTIA